MAVHATPTLLLTRPRAASEKFAAEFGNVEVVICPLMEIVGTGASVDLDGVTGLILTSENAVPFLPRAHLPAYCVGPRTAEAAAAAGYRAQVTGPDAAGLIGALIVKRPSGLLLHCHGLHVRGDVAGQLVQAGLQAEGVAIYDQRAVTPGAEFIAALLRPALVVPLFSTRSATLFAEAAGTLPADARILAFSPAVAEALPTAWEAQIGVLGKPDSAEMAHEIRAAMARRNSP